MLDETEILTVIAKFKFKLEWMEGKCSNIYLLQLLFVERN